MPSEIPAKTLQVKKFQHNVFLIKYINLKFLQHVQTPVLLYNVTKCTEVIALGFSAPLYNKWTVIVAKLQLNLCRIRYYIHIRIE